MRSHRVVLLAVAVLTISWSGCSSKSGPGNQRGFNNGSGNSATYLLYADATAATLNVASVGTSGNLTAIAGPGQIGLRPIAVVTTPDGKFAYVLNADSSTVSQFAVAADGTLSQPASAIGTGLQPTAIAVDPQERFVVVTNTNSGAGATLSVFSINATTGALSAAGTALPLNVGDPKTVTISGDVIYVAEANTIDVLVFSPQTATFAFANGSPFSAGTSETNITALYSPPQASTVLYAADTNTNTLLSFGLSSGALTPTGSLDTGTQPVAVVADNQNRFLFAANAGSSDISVFTVNATTGVLTAASTTALASGAVPNALAYDPANDFLLIGQSGTKQVVPMAVNTSTGGLTTIGAPLTVTNPAAALAVAKP